MTDVVKVPPNIDGSSVKTAAKKILKNKYESTIDTSLGFIILIVKVSVEDIGKIIHGDSSTYHKVDFSVLTFFPKIQEIVGFSTVLDVGKSSRSPCHLQNLFEPFARPCKVILKSGGCDPGHLLMHQLGT